MMQPKRILAPIDFSDHSAQALNAAADIARTFGSELCLAHVVPMIPDLPGSVSILKEGE
jgi:nucleotide-binding universal stress UspA family protein